MPTMSLVYPLCIPICSSELCLLHRDFIPTAACCALRDWLEPMYTKWILVFFPSSTFTFRGVMRFFDDVMRFSWRPWYEVLVNRHSLAPCNRRQSKLPSASVLIILNLICYFPLLLLLQVPHAGWWFGTFFIFPDTGNDHPNWRIFFRGVGQPPTILS